MNGASSNSIDLDAITLESMERDSEVFSAAKSNATGGPWFRGARFGRCIKHPDGRHPGTESPVNPCEIIGEITTSGDHSSYVSTANSILVGSDSEGPILTQSDAEFIVTARNANLDLYVRLLIAEVRRLRAMGQASQEMG